MTCLNRPAGVANKMGWPHSFPFTKLGYGLGASRLDVARSAVKSENELVERLVSLACLPDRVAYQPIKGARGLLAVQQ